MTPPSPHAAREANVFWFIPTHGDGRYLGTSIGARAIGFDDLKQIAQAADTLGYYGALLPTGRSCEDSWVIASALAPLARGTGRDPGPASNNGPFGESIANGPSPDRAQRQAAAS